MISVHKSYVYSSVFKSFINDYISTRREAGFLYDNPAYWLYRFDQYCDTNQIEEATITKTLFERWASRLNSETKTTQNNRLQAVRGFSSYLNTIGISSYIPMKLPRPEKVVPYLMTDTNIRDFFEQVDTHEVRAPIVSFKRMASEYKVLFRIIFCCGLRNNEACSLRVSDVNLFEGSVTIRQSKGNKDRIVYLSADMQKLCADYYNWLNNQLNDHPSQWFFPGRCPENHIPKTSVDSKFNEFWSTTKSAKTCEKKPTVHCLRHAFVIKRINLWMEKDISIQAMMPYLSAYLGHKGPIETFYYYHQVEDVLKTVRRKDTMSGRVIPEVHYEEPKL